jgi:hypothetical protein
VEVCLKVEVGDRGDREYGAGLQVSDRGLGVLNLATQLNLAGVTPQIGDK